MENDSIIESRGEELVCKKRQVSVSKPETMKLIFTAPASEIMKRFFLSMGPVLEQLLGLIGNMRSLFSRKRDLIVSRQT